MKPARLSRRPRLKLTRAGPTRSEKKLRQLNYHNPARLGAKHMMAALILRTWFRSKPPRICARIGPDGKIHRGQYLTMADL